MVVLHLFVINFQFFVGVLSLYFVVSLCPFMPLFGIFGHLFNNFVFLLELSDFQINIRSSFIQSGPLGLCPVGPFGPHME